MQTMKTSLNLWIAGMLLALNFNGLAQPAPSTNQSPRYVAGELLVKFKGGPSGEPAARVKSALQHKVKRDFDFIGWQHIQLPAGMTVDEGLARYKSLPEVLAAEPNYLLRAIEPVPKPVPATYFGSTENKGAGGVIPNDPMFGQQWGLAKIGVTNAWAVTTGGTNVVVAVIDTGINYNHEDLRANMWRNPGEIPGNGIDDDGNGYVDDVYGWDAVANHGDPMDEGAGGNYHGTMATAILGAVGNNGVGIVGVNWSVQLVGVRNGSTANVNSIADTIECFQYVTLMKRRGVNIRATNNSYGTDPNSFSQALKDAIDAAGNEGILHVIAIANESRDLDVNPNSYPECYPSPSIIAVAASDLNDNLASFSAWGRTNVHLAAPGMNITTTLGAGTNSYTTTASGTSFASPHVAGSVALLAAAYPEATASDLKAVLLESVDVLPAFTNKMVSNGRLNVGRAMTRLGEIMISAPLIYAPPQSQTVLAGAAATLAVQVIGARPLDCQWYCGEAMLPGATNSTLTFSNAQLAQSASYTAVLSNRFGTTRAGIATLTVVPLIFTSQPRSQVALVGGSATFSVVVTSTVPVTCQWQCGGTNLTGATSLVLTLTNVQPAQEGAYTAVVSNRFGSVTSDVATLAPMFPATFAQHPQSQTLAVGQDVTFTAAVDGSPPFGYRWRRGGSTLTNLTLNANTSSLTLTNIQAAMAGVYTAVVSNLVSGARVSTNAYLTVVLPPADQGVSAGTDVTLSAVVNGPANGPLGAMRYQWQFNAINLAGATSTNLVLTNVQPAQAGNYTFIVTNTVGMPAGFTARLTVLTDAVLLRIAAVSATTAVTVSFPSATNRLYTLLCCSNLTGAVWTPVPGRVDLLGTGEPLTLTDTNRPTPQAFYRISVRSP
jgi:subtilisin family serine protease